MYLPRLFATDDRPLLLELMRANPFATVIALRDGAPEISHLPLLVLDAPLRIQGHVARGNPLSQLIRDGANLTCVFHGPHAYVSPRIYVNPDNVPTWNYAVVHAHGRARALSDSEVMPHLDALVAEFERGASEPWTADRAGELAQRLVGGVTAFEVVVERLEGKLKLNQNRKPEDREAVIRAFESSGDPAEREVARWMKR